VPWIVWQPAQPLRMKTSSPFAALAFIAVGLRLMGTLRVRTWQLWGAKTADRRCFIIRTSPPRFQIVIFPRFVRNSDVFCFSKPVPARRCRFNRPTQMRTIRGKFIGNLRISPATLQAACARNAPAARRRLRNAAASDHRPRPVRRRRIATRARASFVQKQSPARAAGLFTCELRRV